MTFRKPVTVLREGHGSYVNGLWVPGAKLVVTISASVQPISGGQDIQALPEGRRLTDAVKLYTTDAMVMTSDGTQTQPDIIVHEGYCYEVVSVFKNQSGVISHYKYLAAKIFKFTSTDDWLAGVLKRS